MANRGGDGRTEGRRDGRTEGRTEGRKDGRLEITPCVLQDIGPLGPLPKKEMNKRRNSRKGIIWSAVPDALLGVIK